MMKIIAIAILTFSMAACEDSHTPPQEVSESEMIGAGLGKALPPDELSVMEKKALTGDPHAQALVELHYMEVGDSVLYEKWLEDGAARKDPAAMQRLATHLSMQGGVGCGRAIKLLEEVVRLVPDEKTNLRTVVDIQLRELNGEIEGIPLCQ